MTEKLPMKEENLHSKTYKKAFQNSSFYYHVPRVARESQIILSPCGYVDAVSGQFSSWLQQSPET